MALASTGLLVRILNPPPFRRVVHWVIVTKASEPKKKYKDPDTDLRGAITMEQVRDSVIAYIRKKHAKKVWKQKLYQFRK